MGKTGAAPSQVPSPVRAPPSSGLAAVPWRGGSSPNAGALLRKAPVSGGRRGLNRCGKSCRLRWLNYLRPDIRHGGYTDHEDRVICSLYASIGSRWSIIASKLPGSTDNDVKNYWNTKLKKKALALSVAGAAVVHGGDTFSALSTPPNGGALSWSQAQSSRSLLQPAALSPDASASSSVDTSSSSGDMCFPAAAMYQSPQTMQGLVRLPAPPLPHTTELAPVPTATLLDDAFLADLGAYSDLLFSGLMQEDKSAVAGLELSAAACYFPNVMEMWAGDHAHAKPQQGTLCNTFT